MSRKIYNRSNFHRHTFCVFHEVEMDVVSDKQPDYKSKSGSSYYFIETGVYRLSNHWGRAANCKWRLDANLENTSRTKLGFALWKDFYTDDDSQKIYFITVDYDQKMVNYQHKDSPEYNHGLLLRTAPAVTKTIKEIRNLFSDESWARHYDAPIEFIRESIINQLLTTDKPLMQIKRELLNT